MSEVEPRVKKPRLPPRWFMRFAWSFHRRLYKLTGGRVGLSHPKPNGWGTLRLNTIGRRTGEERSVMVGYFEDGPNLVTMAMNGWGEGEPAWWLNLQAHPEVRVDVADGPRLVTGREALGEERERLWDRWREIDKNLDGYAARRPSQTAVVVLEPRPANSTGHLGDAAEQLSEMRGDNVSALPADRDATSMENIAAAAKDYGLSRFSGETDRMGDAAGGYRSAKKGRRRRRG